MAQQQSSRLHRLLTLLDSILLLDFCLMMLVLLCECYTYTYVEIQCNIFCVYEVCFTNTMFLMMGWCSNFVFQFT